MCGGESARRRMSGERLGRSHGPEYKGLMFHISHFELHSDGKREYLKGFKSESDMPRFIFLERLF